MQKKVPEKDPKRFLSIRLSEDELKEIYHQCERSACRSLTEYAKKVLTREPVIVKVRNESLDELLQAMIGIKNKVQQLAEHAEEKSCLQLQQDLGLILSLTRQVYEKWSR